MITQIVEIVYYLEYWKFSTALLLDSAHLRILLLSSMTDEHPYLARHESSIQQQRIQQWSSHSSQTRKNVLHSQQMNDKMKRILINKKMIGLAVILVLCIGIFVTAEVSKKETSSALFDAVINDDADALRQILDEGANVNARNKDGQTALIEAAYYGNADIVKLLISAGADVNLQDKKDNTALYKAAEGFGILMRKRFKERELSPDGQPVNSHTLDEDIAIIAKLLIEAGADANKKNEGGWTAFMKAAAKNHTKTMEVLLNAGADINARNDDGYTALMITAKGGSADAVPRLIKMGADIHIHTNDLYESALMLAAGKGRINIMQTLIDAGAISDGEKESTWAAFAAAVISNRVEATKLIIEAGAGLDLPFYGWTTLATAALEGSADVMELLIAGGAEVNCQIDEYYRCTALMMASQKGFCDVMEILITAGADINLQDKNGITALMYAADCGQYDAVKMLLDAGADASIRDNNGMTAHALADKGDHTAVAELLEQAH